MGKETSRFRTNITHGTHYIRAVGIKLRKRIGQGEILMDHLTFRKDGTM
jgi:hypothetical protein